MYGEGSIHAFFWKYNNKGSDSKLCIRCHHMIGQISLDSMHLTIAHTSRLLTIHRNYDPYTSRPISRVVIGQKVDYRS